jgi:thioester reductase-like protein
MTHRVLITGASGYLGGTLLARWKSADLPPYDKLFASVRTEEQAEGVKQYGATPLNFSMRDEKAIHDVVVDNGITVVFFLIDAMNSTSQCYFIKALAEVKETTGRDVHFLHVSATT